MQIDINKDMLRTLMVMGGVVEARDPYTGGKANAQQLKPQADKKPIEELVQQMPVELRF